MSFCRRAFLQLYLHPAHALKIHHARNISTLHDMYHSVNEILAEPNQYVPRKNLPRGTFNSSEYRHRKRASRLDFPQLFKLLRQSTEDQAHAVCNEILSDIFKLPEEKANIHALISILTPRNLSLFSTDSLLRLAQYLANTTTGNQFFQSGNIEPLLERVTIDSNTRPELLRQLLPHVVHRVKSTRIPQLGIKALTTDNYKAFDAAIAFNGKLVAAGMESEALQTLTALVEQKVIPAEIATSVDGNQSFRFIANSSLIRSALHWNRYAPALRVLEWMITDPHLPSPPYAPAVELCLETLEKVLADGSPSKNDLSVLVPLLPDIHRITPIPDHLIQALYHLCTRLRHRDAAAALYIFTQQARVLPHQYPLPLRGSLVFVLESLLSPFSLDKSVHESTVPSSFSMVSVPGARALVRQVVDGDIPLPSHDRASFISTAAQAGFARPARALYERHCKARNVGGSAKVMLRLVSLFSHLSDKASTRQAPFQTAVVKKGFVGPSPDPTQVYSELSELERQEKDYSDFAEGVLSRFRAVHSPLEDADHITLSALARGYFLLGKYQEGHETFRILFARKEAPDLIDVNVMLTALASHSPRSACSMIDVMINRGLRPDAVSFGTVLHAAGVAGDFELMSYLLQRALAQPNPALLDVKSVLSLMKAIVHEPPDREDPTAMKEHIRRLHMIQDVVISLHQSNTVYREQPAIGKFLILRSLKVGMPRMALKFWRILCRETENWEDREQVFIRRAIMRAYKAKHGTGRIPELLDRPEKYPCR